MCCGDCGSRICYILLFFLFIPVVTILLIVILYFAFAGIMQLSIYTFIYSWLALFSKNSIHLAMSILVNLSDFGFYFYLLLFVVFFIMEFFPQLFAGVPNIFKNLKKSIGDLGSGCMGIIWGVILIFVIGFGCLFSYCIIDQERLSKTAFAFSCIMLFGVFILEIISFFVFTDIKCPCSKHKKNDSSSEDDDNVNNNVEPELNNIENDAENKDDNENDDKIAQRVEYEEIVEKASNNEDASDNGNKKKDESEEEEAFLMYLRVMMMGALAGMFARDSGDSKCRCCFTRYRLILSIIIVGLQLYSVIYPFVKGDVKLVWFLLLVAVKIIFGFRILSINLIDSLINIKETMRRFEKMKIKICYWISFILYIILIALLVCIYVYFMVTSYPTIDNASYIEDNKIWYKIGGNKTFHPEGFCYATAKNDGSLKTEDFAVLTTLPRLYDVNDNGKCFIKPAKRGLFNSTMKYIFGKDYEKQGIKIYCKRLSHYQTLVLTSEKILQRTLSYYSKDSNITMIDNHEDEIINNDYFEMNEIKTDEKGDSLLRNYKECVSSKSTARCENEWDKFTQYYWPHSFTDSYENISGFERYQITIESDTLLQPSFIVDGNQTMAGTHYIIGGGFEDHWGFGCLIETFGRKYVPQLFDNIIPFYSFIRSLLRDIFNNLDWFNRKLVYVERLSTNEMTALTELYTQFNFSHESLFTIGHSISGSAQKGVSYYTDINGIVFDSSLGENMGDFETAPNFIRSGTINQITNVYSDGCFLTGIDDDCPVNGVLPRRYYNPSVYDSACLTTMMCSETNRYVPYCKQVLTQNSKDPIEEFKKSMNALYDHYGIQYE